MAACQAGGHTHVAVEAMIGLGRVRYQLGQGDEAARQLRSAEALAHQIANRELLDQVTKTLAETVGGAASPLPGNLSVRQAEVLGLLANGLSNKEIAARLYLSPGTVERHLATIYRKLGLGGRVDAAPYAVEHGLEPDPMSVLPGSGLVSRVELDMSLASLRAFSSTYSNRSAGHVLSAEAIYR